MEKFEFSDINKFLTSLGVILIILAVSFQFLLIYNMDILLIKNTDIKNLTNDAIFTIRNHQNHLRWLSKYGKFISVSIGILGIISISIGIYRWIARQNISDAIQNLDLEEKKITSRTEVEKNERLKEEATKLLADHAEEIFSNIEPFNPVVKVGIDEYVKNSKLAEEIIFTKVAAAYTANYIPKKNVSVDGNEYDIILYSKQNDKRSDIIVEIKFIDPLIFHRVTESLRQFISAFSTYKSKLNRTVTPVLIFVTDKVLDDKEKMAFKEMIIQETISYNVIIRIKIFAFAELLNIETALFIVDDN